MAASGKCAVFAADGQSDIKILRGIIFNSTTADRVDLKAGSSSGTALISFIIAAAGVAVLNLGDGIVSPVGNWYVDVTTTGAPLITIWGD
jgi:hypothetical protein